MIAAKCSMHYGKKMSLRHNLRDYDANIWNKDGHIDATRSAENVTLVNKNLREFFDEVFGEALNEFNEKNRTKHPERMKTMGAYYRENKGKAMEFIFQLGDHQNYWDMVDTVGQAAADDFYKTHLTQIFEKWQEQNPSWRVFSATIHMDEVGERGEGRGGTPHLHLDVLPVAEQSRGMTVRCSVDGALKSIGYARTKGGDSYGATPFKRWAADWRETVEHMAAEHVAQSRAPMMILPSEPCQTTHMQPQEWRRQHKERKSAVQAIKDITSGKRKQQQEAAEYICAHANASRNAIMADVEKEKHDTLLQKHLNEEIQTALQESTRRFSAEQERFEEEKKERRREFAEQERRLEQREDDVERREFNADCRESDLERSERAVKAQRDKIPMEIDKGIREGVERYTAHINTYERMTRATPNYNKRLAELKEEENNDENDINKSAYQGWQKGR